MASRLDYTYLDIRRQVNENAIRRELKGVEAGVMLQALSLEL